MNRPIAVAAILTLAFAAPGGAQTPPDVLVVGQVAEPASLDPHAVTATNDFRILANLYEGLVRFRSGTLEVEPALATDWTISDDGLTYRFDLRDGVAFHDGAPFDAAAVKFNFDRMLDDDHPHHGTGPFPLAFFFSVVAQTRVVDADTIEFRLSEPFAPFLANLASPTGSIVSPAAVETHGRAFGRNPSGTGPFRFAAWEPDGRVTITGNQDHWSGAPALRSVVFRPIPEAGARAEALLAGEIDLAAEIPPAGLPDLREDAGYTVHEAAGPHLWFLILNTREGPFSDKRVRQAVNYAINKEALVNGVLGGGAEIAAGPIPSAFAWADDGAVEPYPHDPERARELIRDAGAQGAEVTFMIPEDGSGMLDPVAMAAAIQADLAAVGLNARLETYEWSTFLSNVNPGLEGRADMAGMAWLTNDPDTLPFLALRTDAMPSRGGFNAGYYSNPEVDELITKARRSTDQARRARLYNDIQRIVHDDAPWAFIANWKQNAVSSAAVEGFDLEPTFLFDLSDVSKN